MPPSTILFHRSTEECIVQSRNNAGSHNRPSRPHHRDVLEAKTQIPRQMPESIEGVVEEGERERRLRGNLCENGPCSHSGDHGGSLEMPAQGRGSEVCEAEEVQRAAQHDAGDTVQRGTVPCDLRAVDGEMGGDGTLETLLAEDFLAFGLLDVLGGGESAMVC